MNPETNLTNKVINRFRLGVIIALSFLVIVIIGFVVFFMISLSPVSKEDTNVQFTIEKGASINKVADDLKGANLIRNAFVFKVYVRLNDFSNFQAGTYNIKRNMNVEELINSFLTGSNTIQDTVSITFVEGKRFPYFVKKIAESFPYTEEEIYAVAKDENFLNKIINDYWFIDEDILNKDIYYPLEGYLFPDTYDFKKDSTIESIFLKLLDEMQNKLEPYREEINVSDKKISSLLTLASVVELEAVKPEHRQEVAGVFNNRLKLGMSLGSDVTTYYAEQKEMTEKLYQSELDACNAYNTRGTCVKGLPVGPICCPSLSSIVAAITPMETDALYFVADTENKVYFSKTYEEQAMTIAKIKNEGKWPE